MATIVNARDVELQATTPRMVYVTLPDNWQFNSLKGVKITAPSQIFQVATDGTSTPGSIILTATNVQISGAISWTVLAGGATLTSTTDISPATATLAFADMTTPAVTIRATVVDSATGFTYSGDFTIAQVADGLAAKLLAIQPSSQVFQIAKDGSNTPASITLALSQQNLAAASTPTFTVVSGTATLVGTGNSRTLDFGDMGSDSVTVQVNQDGVSDQITIVKVREGLDSIQGYLSNEAQTLPATAGGVVTSFTGADGKFRVLKGITDVTSGSTFSVLNNPDNVNVTISGTGDYSVTGAGSWANGNNSTFVDFHAVYGGVGIDRRLTLTKSLTGTTGTNGSRQATITMFKWAGAMPVTYPSGTSTYTWATSTFTAPATPNGWTITPGAPSPGQTLYAISQSYSDSATATTAAIIWGSTSPYVMGYAGQDATASNRVTIVGFGSAYNLTTTSWADSNPYSSSNVADTQANAVIYNILNGTNLATLTTTTHLRIGDSVTLSSSTFARQKYWNGTAWKQVGTVINGDMIVTGTFSADQINGGTIDASAVNLGSGAFQVTTGGAVTASSFFGYNSQFGQTFSPGSPCIKATSALAFGSATGNVIEALVDYNAGSGQYGNSLAIFAQSKSPSSTAHAFRGMWNKFGTSTDPGRGVVGLVSSGIVGATNGNAFYAESGTVGPFTGSHEVAWPAGGDFEPGDIVMDDVCLLRNGLSNTLFAVALSTQPKQKGVVGVLAYRVGPMNRMSTIAAVPGNPTSLTVGEDGVVSGPPEFEAIKDSFDLAVINALGEGQMNVCGMGGDLEKGDLICASAIPGKGMRQNMGDGSSDDLVRGFTVARAREAVSFASPTEVKQVACIYLAG